MKESPKLHSHSDNRLSLNFRISISKKNASFFLAFGKGLLPSLGCAKTDILQSSSLHIFPKWLVDPVRSFLKKNSSLPVLKVYAVDKGYLATVDLGAEIKSNTNGGFGVYYESSTGDNTTYIGSLLIKWNK